MIVLYKGARGRGKTLTMVKDAFRFFENKYKIYANFHLAFGEFISSEEVLNLSRNSELRDCVLVIDEIELFFDSRNFNKGESKTFSNFLQQIRKRNMIILCTTQYTNLIDLRIRQQIDLICYPDFDKKTGFCSCNYFDLTKIEDDQKRVNISPCLVVYNAKPIFQLYDTYELLV